MIGSFLTSGLVMIFGYAYPAYECFKTVERNKPEIEQLRFWCQYWILVALLAVCERVADVFISWVPMYCEAKLAFYIYLWYPKTKGTVHVYDTFVKPYIVKHEKDIDRKLMELRTRAGDIVVFYFQKASSYSQARFFEILQYVASQPFPRPYQNQAQPQKPISKAARQVIVEEPPSPNSSTSSSQHEDETENEVSTISATAKSVQVTLKKRATDSKNVEASINLAVKSENTDESANLAESEETEAAPPQETSMEEVIRVTRSRLTKSRSISKKDE